MRQNPFDPNNLQSGTTPDSFKMGNPMHAPFAFKTQNEPVVEDTAINVEAVETLRELLQTMAKTFEEHDMFELAEQAKSVSAML